MYDGVMNDPLSGLDEALDAVRSAWRVHGRAVVPAGELGRTRLIAVNDALGALRRHLDSVQTQVAAEIARESRAELGAQSLANEQGFRTPALLIAEATGISTGDAIRLVKVGEATAAGSTLTGESLPARHPFVAEALRSGLIGVQAASAIIRMLDRVALRTDRESRDRAEQTLAEKAAGLSLDQLAKVIVRAEAWLDPDGLEPKERERRNERALHLFERDGMVHVRATLDPESAAPLKTALEAMVSAAFRAAKNGGPATPALSVPQLQADALTTLAWHVLGCAHEDLPLDGATVIVRVALDDLENATGAATIDGIAQPVSVSAVRRLASGGGVIPCVLGTRSEILDWGREKRLFTRVQKLALAERDGGCAMCGLPPGMTRAHHIRWWRRHRGATDLSNGLLLCESCHQRIHDNGWDIRIDGGGTTAKVLFIPPPHIDPARAPRLGGRARFDYLAA